MQKTNNLDIDNVFGEVSNDNYKHLENYFKRREQELRITPKRLIETIKPKENYYIYKKI